MFVHLQKIKRKSAWRIHWQDIWGKRHSKSFSNELTARSYAEMLINHIEAERNRSSLLVSEMTLETALEIFLSNVPLQTESSRHTYYASLNNFLQQFRSRQLAAISPIDLMKYLNTRQKTLQPTSYRYQVGRLKQFFRFARAQNLIVKNPAENLYAPPARSSKGFCLSYPQEYKILQAATPIQRPRMIICLDTGMRARDMFRLKAGAFNFDEKLITFEIKKAANLVITLPMTKRLFQIALEFKGRAFPTTHRIYDTAREWPVGPGDYLFPLSYSTTSDATTSLCHTNEKHSGVHFTLHDMRHTFFTRLYEASRDKELAKHCLGHLIDTYLHPTPEALRIAFDKMEAAREDAFSKLRTPVEISDAEIWRELKEEK